MREIDFLKEDCMVIVGTWRIRPEMSGRPKDDNAIQELREDHYYETILQSVRYDDAEKIVQAHNAMVEKMNERTIRQVCEDSGIPIKMTKDGLEIGGVSNA